MFTGSHRNCYPGEVLNESIPNLPRGAALVSLLTLFYEANHPQLYAMVRKPGTDVFRPLTEEHLDDETISGLLIVQTEGRMTFASAPRVRDRLWSFIDEAGPRRRKGSSRTLPRADLKKTGIRESQA